MVVQKTTLTLTDILQIKRAKMARKLEKKATNKIVNGRIKKLLKLWLENGLYKCEVCTKNNKSNFTSIQPATLEGHVSSHHPEYEPFRCNLCDETFKRFTSRTAHIKKAHYGTLLLKLKL
eukprot:GFUD01131401.1.p1 GENE.GFUD01131401.1~~GFUD01131401.1.p1  ORF type:complete len:120 (-),score=17.76 GFUD01131401.1:32-391(-)